jgi:hypothetical protein
MPMYATFKENVAGNLTFRGSMARGGSIWRHKNSRLLQRPMTMVPGYCHWRTTEKRFVELSSIPSLLHVLCAFCVVAGEAENKKNVKLWSLGLEFVGHALLLREMLSVVHPQRRYR